MHHAFNRVLRKDSGKIVRVTEITFNAWSGADERSMAGGKVVKNYGFESGLSERLYGMASDIPSTACH